MTGSTWRPWRAAATEALYGGHGFFRRPEGPAGHFRTSVSAGPLPFARALLRLAARVDVALGRPAVFDLVDVGAGRGELLTAVAATAAGRPGAADLSGRLRLTGVEVAPRPPGLPPHIGWTATIPGLRGLLVANEWLDDVPLDVVRVTAAGPRVLLVAADGRERAGPPPPAADLAWLARWWPLDGARAGDRAEVGRPRDEAWAGAVRAVERGVAVAVDYAHARPERAAGCHAGGTLRGYWAGRLVPPVPDGSCDLTAHVALDACAAAGQAAGATATLLTTQRTALHALGERGRRPPSALAAADPAGYVRALAAGGVVAELTDPAGLGGFGWLVQSVGVPPPLPAPSERR